MICDDCIKKDVCKYREQCNILERDVLHGKIEDVITLEVKCKHKETRPYTLPRQPYNVETVPLTEPLDGGKIWISPNTGPRPTVRYDDETGCVPR